MVFEETVWKIKAKSNTKHMYVHRAHNTYKHAYNTKYFQVMTQKSIYLTSEIKKKMNA